MQAFIAPVLRLGHWEAQERVYWYKVSRQTEPNHQYFFSHPLNLAYYRVCMGIGGWCDNLAQPSVMASKTLPQILPKEGDSFFSSL